jgi:hypothetical protein
MAAKNQIIYIGQLLYKGGCGFQTAGKYSKIAESLSDKEASKVIDHLVKHGTEGMDFWEDGLNEDIFTDLIKEIDKCGLCGKNREPVNSPDSCNC